MEGIGTSFHWEATGLLSVGDWLDLDPGASYSSCWCLTGRRDIERQLQRSGQESRSESHSSGTKPKCHLRRLNSPIGRQEVTRGSPTVSTDSLSTHRVTCVAGEMLRQMCLQILQFEPTSQNVQTKPRCLCRHQVGPPLCTRLWWPRMQFAHLRSLSRNLRWRV